MNLTIRKMNMNDLEPLHELLSEPQVMHYLEPPYTREKTKQFLINFGMSAPPGVYAVDKGNTFIGYVIFHAYDEVSIEIGWVNLNAVFDTKVSVNLRARQNGKATVFRFSSGRSTRPVC